MKKHIFSTIFLSLSVLLIAQNPSYNMLIGSYTEGTKSEGIYSCEIKPETGEVKLLSVASEVKNPSYLAFSPDKNFVYAVSEMGENSKLAGFYFDKNTGKLKFIQSQATFSADPCFLAVRNFHIATANYSGGDISVFNRKMDGTFSAPVEFVRHSAETDSNQKKSHVHQLKYSPDGKFLIATDLGTDELYVYKYIGSPKYKTLNFVNKIKLKEKSGPRHFEINKKGNRIYVIHENDGTLSVLSINKRGKLKLLQETSLALKQDTKAAAADIHLSPDEKFIYASNRGNANDLSCFSINKKGLLSFVEQVSTEGKGPRNFTITPDGNYIFVGHQYSNNISLFKRNKENGKLTYLGNDIKIPSAVCLLLY